MVATKQHRLLVCGALLCLLVGPLAAGYAEDKICSDAWYERMREPWTPRSRGFIREWLVLGEFPNPPHNDGLCVGCDTDYLAEHGGEEHIQPVEGMAHTRPDGSIATWAPWVSTKDVINFVEAFSGRPTEDTVGYAYAVLEVEEAGPAVLALGSDDGVMVWVNGKLIHRNIVGRSIVVDNDLVTVDLQKGKNRILIKVEQGRYGWGFCCRLLDQDAARVRVSKEFSPAVLSSPNSDMLTVRSDTLSDETITVRIEVVGAGGGIVASQLAVRGENVVFSSLDWSEGAYEVRCSLELPFGETRTRHLQWYKGHAATAVRRLLDAAGDAQPTAPHGMIITMLADLVRNRLDGELEHIPDDKVYAIHSALMEFEELELERLKQISRVRPFGFVRLAYRDEIDDSPQFCRVYLPPGYDSSREWPMVVYLHGANPENPEYIRWWGVDARHHDRADDYGVIYVEPHGRGNTEFTGIGERDVLRCIAMAKESFAVDDDRVYLTGESMGGTGTWNVGSRKPEFFAAIAPVFGGWDYRVSSPNEYLATLTPYQRLLHERASSFEQAEALLTTPVFVNHGAADHIVPVENSRFIVRLLQRWGYDVRYWEAPAGGHFDNHHWPAIMPWLLEHTRHRNPRIVRIRSTNLKGAAAHWVRVERRANPLTLIHAEAEVVADNVIRLDTENVLAVTLSLPNQWLDPSLPVRVIWNETDVRTVAGDCDEAMLVTTALQEDLPLKSPGLEGPMWDLYSTPFAVVLGTVSPDPLMRAFCERHAKNVTAVWEDWQKHPPRFYQDVELKEADLAAYSLLLIGGPDANVITRKLIDQLPLAIEGETVILDGHSFHAPDAAVHMIYPNPLNPDRYVAVIAATSGKGMFFAGTGSEDYDFSICDGQYGDVRDGRVDEKTLIACGSFDYAWRLSEQFFVRGDASLRASGVTHKVPTLLHARVAGKRLYLSELVEHNAVKSFRHLERDLNARREPLTLAGRTYERGLSVVPWNMPGSADWDLRGGKWTTLRGTIGLEYNDSDDIDDQDRENVRVRFAVLGDGIDLFRSHVFDTETPPYEIDISVEGVETLTLMVHNEALWSRAIKCADWADLRLEKRLPPVAKLSSAKSFSKADRPKKRR